MTICSYGFAPRDEGTDDGTRELELFSKNIALFEERREAILSCREYFFCRTAFAFCSWPYIGGDGPFVIGHLLLGWNGAALTGECSNCGGMVLVFRFGGSPLSGSNKWTGICKDCGQQQTGSWRGFQDHWRFAASVKKCFPFEVAEWEEFDGYVFDWGGTGLKPARKTRLVWKPTADAVSLQVLVSELKSGQFRQGEPPQPVYRDEQIQVKFSNKQGATFHWPPDAPHDNPTN